MRKGFVLNAAVPAAEKSISAVASSVACLQKAGVGVVEVFTQAENARVCKDILDEYSMQGIFLAGIPLKRYGINLCAPDRIEAENALEKLFSFIDPAIEAGFETVLITSGKCPAPENLARARDAFIAAVDAIFGRYGEGLRVVLEPSDRAVDSMQYIGPTAEAVEITRSISKSHKTFSLTLDTSHLAQLNEDVAASLKLGADTCHHVHLANCILKPGHSLYGDKHPMLDHEDAALAPGAVRRIYEDLGTIFDLDDTIVSVEIIDRSGRPEGSLREIIEAYPWFFARNQ